MSILVWVGLFVVVISITLWIWPKAMRVQTRKVEDLLTEALLDVPQNRLVEAEQLLNEALQVIKSERGADFSRHCSCLVHLGAVYARQNKYQEARSAYDELKMIWRQAISDNDFSKFSDIDYLAATGDFGSATSDFAQIYALVIDAKKASPVLNHADIAQSLLIYSQLLHKLGFKAESEKAQLEAAQLNSPQQQPDL